MGCVQSTLRCVVFFLGVVVTKVRGSSDGKKLEKIPIIVVLLSALKFLAVMYEWIAAISIFGPRCPSR